MTWRIYLLTACGVIEMVLFSGVIFGWANLVLVLKSDGYFSDLCASSSPRDNASIAAADDKLKGCTGQNDRLTLAFTIAVFSFNAAGFVGGVIFDRAGTRVTRLVACIFLFLSGVFAFLMEKDTANLTFAWIICLSFSGMLVAISLFQIAQLHPNHRLAVSSLLSGALDSSSVVFLIFKTCYDAGIGLRWILISYAAIAIVWLTTTTFVFLPKTSFVLENEKNQEEFTTDMEITTVTTVTNADDSGETLEKVKDSTEKISQKEHQPEEKPVTDDKFSSGWRYILTAKYFWLFYYLSIVQLRLWFFVGSLNTFLEFRTDNDKEKIDSYTGRFGMTQFFGFFFAPFTGIIMDLKPRSIRHPFFGPILSFLITNALCVLLGVLVLVPVLEIQYLSFVVQVAMRAFLFASLISFIFRAFPVIHYGKLYGTCIMSGAVISLLQYPAFIILDGPFNGDPFWVNVGFLTLSFTGFGLPLYLWLSFKEEGEMTTTL